MTDARIPAGTFLYGDPPAPAHTGAYEIDIVPVTVEQYARFIEAGGPVPRFWGEEEWRAVLDPRNPVVGVSWDDAEACARWLGRRLPTELEWERAARGEDGREYPWGNGWDPARAHHRGGPRHPLPVGGFPSGASPHGLLDTAGNVWEWCAGQFAPGLRPARGGAWNAHPEQLRCASRNGWPPGARFSNIGFRTCL